MSDTVEQPPAVPVRSSLRTSHLLEPIDPKKPALKDEPQPLSPATAPHEVYLSSEEDASSTADDFSDYDLDSDSDLLDPDVDYRRDSHEDTARAVSIIYHGKPSIIQMPPRALTTPSFYSFTEDSYQHEEPAVEAPTAVAQRRTTRPRPTTTIAPSYSTPSVPSFLDVDPFASRPGSGHHFRQAVETNQTSKSAGSMLKRTLSLARKRSQPALNQAYSHSQDALPVRPGSAETDEQGYEGPIEPRSSVSPSKMASRARRASTMVQGPPRESESRFTKGHSRLRSSLSITMGRRKQ